VNWFGLGLKWYSAKLEQAPTPVFFLLNEDGGSALSKTSEYKQALTLKSLETYANRRGV